MNIINKESTRLKIIILIIIILLLINIFIFGKNVKEHFADITLSSEAIQNVASVYGNVVTGSFNNLDVKGTFNMLPKGCIISFNGENSPVGWAICDGNNGTPDLRGRFIRSSGTKSNIPIKIATNDDLPFNTYSRNDPNSKLGKLLDHSFGDFGGTDVRIQHIRELANHNHPASRFDGNNTCNCGKGKCACSIGWGTTDAAGEGGGMGIQPPYYVLTYIMKL